LIGKKKRKRREGRAYERHQPLLRGKRRGNEIDLYRKSRHFPSSSHLFEGKCLPLEGKRRSLIASLRMDRLFKGEKKRATIKVSLPQDEGREIGVGRKSLSERRGKKRKRRVFL